MAIYEYECKVHGEFEVIQKISDPPLDKCPHCVEEKLETLLPPKKLISLSSFALVGGGWAKEGYK